MPPLPPSTSGRHVTVWRRAVTVLLSAVVTTFALVVVGMPAASAHDELVGSAPAADATVPTAPGAVTLEFSGTIQSLGTQVVVTGPDGAVASEGPVEIDGSTVGQPLAADVQAGVHTVTWKATSSDGHPLSGEFAFTVATAAEPSTEPAPSTTPAAPTTGPAAIPSETADGADVSEAASQEQSADSTSSSFWIATGAIVVLLIAGALLVLRRRRT